MIIEQTIKHLLRHDYLHEYQAAINVLCDKYSKLTQWKNEISFLPSSVVIDSCEIAIKAAIEADYYANNQDFKFAGIVTKLMLKSLKIAQGVLSLMLIKSPLKVAIAYNALHWVINLIEGKENKEHIKKHDKRKVNKK
jgi:hypothetical protein